MKNLQLFLKNFIKNEGFYVFISLFIGKVCGFLASWLIIRMLPVEEFGLLTIVASTFAIFTTFNGFGSQQSLLRFGSISTDIEEKKSLSAYLFRQGLSYQIILSIAFFASSLFFIQKFEDIFLVFLFFSIRLIGFYFFNHVQSYLRISGKNKTFSAVNNAVNILGLLLLLVCTYLYGFKGYLFAIAFAPFISIFWFRKVPVKFPKMKFSFSKKELFNYGIFASGTVLLSDLLFSADILILGFLLNDIAVANYKVALLLPANITFLSLVFMQTDFPELAKNYKNKSYLKNYVFNYYKLFIPICSFILLIGLFFNNEILHLFFGEKYHGNAIYFSILLIGFVFNMLFRNLFGNLLSAVGKIKLNSYVSFASLFLFVLLAFILVPKYEILGMVYSLTLCLAFTGVVFAFLFYKYYKHLK